MKTKSTSRSAFFNPRVLIAFVLCSVGLLLALAGLSKSVTDSFGNPVLKTGMAATTATAQTPGTWTATGSMSTTRWAHTATLLPSGKVLVAGGIDAAGLSLASAELYDPSTGQWTTTGAMATPRGFQRAILLPDGKVLVAGGQTAYCTQTATAELYDPVSGTWASTGSLNDARGQPLAVLITASPLASMVLIAGGDSDCNGGPAIASAELYDPNTGTWSRTSSMSTARDFAGTATLPVLPDGSVLAVGGGTCCPYHWINSAESFDPVTQSWTPAAPKTTKAQGDAVLMQNGVVLVAGGLHGSQPTSVTVAAAELFDPSTDTWTPTSSMSVERDQHSLTLLANGQALAAGGYSGGWSLGCTDQTSAELYDSNVGTWFATGNMTVARLLATATLLPNGQVLVTGGHDCEGHILSSAELYTPPPVATLSTTSLTFGAQLVNTRSAAQNATLTNTGTTTLTISSIAASADFLQKNNCGSSLPAGASCTIKVAFNPSAQGVLTGSVTITDDAANSPQTIALTGTGTVVQVSPPALNFGDQAVGTTSDPQTATITNTGSTDLHIAGVAIRGTHFGDFAETTTCGTKLPAGGSCAVNVTFTPTAKGARHATLLIQDSGGDSPQAVHLTGTGL